MTRNPERSKGRTATSKLEQSLILMRLSLSSGHDDTRFADLRFSHSWGDERALELPVIQHYLSVNRCAGAKGLTLSTELRTWPSSPSSKNGPGSGTSAANCLRCPIICWKTSVFAAPISRAKRTLPKNDPFFRCQPCTQRVHGLFHFQTSSSLRMRTAAPSRSSY